MTFAPYTHPHPHPHPQQSEPDTSRVTPPPDGWSGVLRRPPERWSVLQTVLWLEASGVACDLSVLVHGQVAAVG